MAPTQDTRPMAQPAYEHQHRPVSRAAFYAIACDPRRSVAVEACAGAGKTWMLVSRILRALLDGADGADGHSPTGVAPHEILAITFTKKAAGEMRERLHEWLQTFSHQPPQVLAQELMARGVSAAAAQRASAPLQALHRQLLGLGRPVQIRTFHGWFAALLRTAPVAVLRDLDLPPHYELLEDDAQAVAQVWRPFLGAVARDEALRADYQAVVRLHGRFQTHKALAAALSKRVEFALADGEGVVAESVQHFADRWPNLAAWPTPAHALGGDAARQRWLAWAKALGAEPLKTPQKAANAVIDAFAKDDLDERLDTLRKGFFVAEEDRLTQHLQKYTAAKEAAPELQNLCLARRQHAAWDYQQRMARLTRCLIAEFGAVKRSHGWVDMNDVERAALVLLSDPVLSGWVHERLDARIKHLLIDEFQDTNPLQWQALHAWLSGYAGAGGGASGGAAPSVFIVGDPKQSIYRFRRAEPQVFKAAQAFVVQGLGGDLLSCDHTRRNASGVIEVVNHVMLAAQAAGEYPDYRPHTTERTSERGNQLDRPPALQTLPPIARPAKSAIPGAEPEPLAWRDSLTTPRELPEETLRALESRQAAQWVAAQLAAGLPAEGVMVLARKRDRLAAMQEALRSLNIPTEQPEKLDLAEAPEVQDVIALLDALTSPAHNLSLARALKSPLFGLDDAGLTQLAQQAQQAMLHRPDPSPRVSWLALLQNGDPALPTPDLTPLPASLHTLGSVLTQYQQWLATLPPHDALHAIYHHGDVLARFAAAAPAPQRQRVLANLRALLSASLSLDGARYLTPYALVRAFKKGRIKAPNLANAQAVRLLTIHGAKGLEARAVLLLDTDGPPARADNMSVLVDWPGQAAAPRKFIFMASESAPPPCAQETLEADQTERRREELNALYVALTRAQDVLAISSVEPKNANETSWWRRLLPLSQAVALPTRDEGEPSPVAPLPQGFFMPVLPQLPPPAPEPQPGTNPARKPPTPSTPASRQGQAMHRLLEQADAAQAASARWSASRLGQLAQEFDISAEQTHSAAAMAQTILKGEGAWAWDAAQINWHGNEVELVHAGQRLRLDRLVRHPRTGWWVLDYKSAAAPEMQTELLEQMRTYRAAVQTAYPGEPVSAAFLTGTGRLVVID